MPLFALLLLLLVLPAAADELSVNFGGGPQPDADQSNWGGGADWEFWRTSRSPRQQLSLGASISQLATDGSGNQQLTAIGFYPQLTLLAPPRDGWQPYFFVRALGPHWLSERSLGERQQGEHFAFQAQVGVGLVAPEDWFIALSYKHFSNAKLFEPNDGIDLPLVLTLGQRW